jgi:glyoxylase I family protein
MTSTASGPIAAAQGIAHVRLTVTDIDRSKSFYNSVFGAEPAFDFSAKASDPAVRDDPEQLFGGCVYALGDQILGLRPAAPSTDSFDSTRVGLDHVSLKLGSLDDLKAAAGRLHEAGSAHGDLKELTDFGMAIVSFQDPDDINLELSAPLPE